MLEGLQLKYFKWKRIHMILFLYNYKNTFLKEVHSQGIGKSFPSLWEKLYEIISHRYVASSGIAGVGVKSPCREPQYGFKWSSQPFGAILDEGSKTEDTEVLFQDPKLKKRTCLAKEDI